MKIVSFETANSYIKLFDQGKKVITYPNTWTYAPLEVIGRQSIRTYKLGEDSFQVGVSRNFQSSSGKGADRYEKESFYAESIIALAHVVEDGEKIIASTGLPANHYTQSIIESLKDKFEKTHIVEVDGKIKKFTIKELDVFLQPLGSFFYSLVDDNGEPRSTYDELMGGQILIVDIGFGSTDIAEIRQGQLFDYHEVDTAMVDAYQGLISRMRAKYADSPVETATLHPLRVEIETRDKDSFQFGGESYPIAELREKAFDQTAKRIMDAVTNLKQLRNFDKIIFTGGGVDALRTHLNKHLKVANAVPLKNSQEANVRGFNVFSQFSRMK